MYAKPKQHPLSSHSPKIITPYKIKAHSSPRQHSSDQIQCSVPCLHCQLLQLQCPKYSSVQPQCIMPACRCWKSLCAGPQNGMHSKCAFERQAQWSAMLIPCIMQAQSCIAVHAVYRAELPSTYAASTTAGASKPPELAFTGTAAVKSLCCIDVLTPLNSHSRV